MSKQSKPVSVVVYPSYMYALLGPDPGQYLATPAEKAHPDFKNQHIVTRTGEFVERKDSPKTAT